jgi:hypothetical protein
LYILQGNFGIARAYPWCDVTGTYVNGRSQEDVAQGPTGFLLLDQTSPAPVSIAQINDNAIVGGAPLTADELVVMAYQGIIAGARAIGVFADYYGPDAPESGIEHAPWSAAMPQLAEEIRALLPVLRTPRGKVWMQGGLELGLRTEPDGTRWLFVVNPSMAASADSLVFANAQRAVNHRTQEIRATEPLAIELGPLSTEIWRIDPK